MYLDHKRTFVMFILGYDRLSKTWQENITEGIGPAGLEPPLEADDIPKFI